MELYDYLLLPSEQKVKAIEETLEQIGRNLKAFENQHKYDTERYITLQSKFYELEQENEHLKTKLTILLNKQRIKKSKGEK